MPKTQIDLSGETVSYFAAAAVRGPKGWTATDVDLSGVSDVEDVADRLRDADAEAEVSLLFVESDDTYLAVLRLDEGEDLRIFGSDAAFAEESRLGAVLLGEEEVAAPVDLDEDYSGSDSDTDPVGDADLLADLGVSAARLLELCAHEGLMPADITSEICQTLGCGDDVEELREA